jgi:uncharacterized protein YaiL (DUF2058 family)
MSKLTLQEQLLKAGLVSEKKLKKTQKSSKKSRVQSREAKAAVEATKTAQRERDIELNKQREAQKLDKAVQAQVKQLIEMNKLDLNNGEIKYNFTDNNVIKSLYVTQPLRNELLNGILSVARYETSYVVIPSSVAKKIAERDPQAIIENKTATEEVLAEDDPYAQYVVPDDLMW